ncbi:hypothetical protein PIB30_107029 [Stylosanthes scabra]|uniref:Uncharacterized protein n=1 Tax=Stylosanthes scabra TaxID=79078 RepID=A0ABU6UY62_9FABA|nr:hypothetical protein [Stylosanthes scabra]
MHGQACRVTPGVAQRSKRQQSSRICEKLKKGSLQIKKRNLAANQSRVPRMCVVEHAYACCSNPTHA